MNEPNGEADFCASKTAYGGVFGVELTHDAGRHIAIRMVLWSYRHECTDTWKLFFDQWNKSYGHLNNSSNNIKIDGQKGC